MRRNFGHTGIHQIFFFFLDQKSLQTESTLIVNKQVPVADGF